MQERLRVFRRAGCLVYRHAASRHACHSRGGRGASSGVLRAGWLPSGNKCVCCIHLMHTRHIPAALHAACLSCGSARTVTCQRLLQGVVRLLMHMLCRRAVSCCDLVSASGALLAHSVCRRGAIDSRRRTAWCCTHLHACAHGLCVFF